MISDTLQTVKPLTRPLEEALRECYNREQKKIEPVVNCSYDTIFELIERGMLSAKTIMKNKKATYAFYVTQLGIDYLATL